MRGKFVIIKKRDDSEILHVNHVTLNTKEKDLELKPKQDCTLDSCHVVTSSIFAIWWKKSLGLSYWQGKAEVLGETMSKIREDLMKNFSLPDPPNIHKGLYVNVYIAHNNGNGVGTEYPEFVPFINFQNIVICSNSSLLFKSQSWSFRLMV